MLPSDVEVPASTKIHKPDKKSNHPTGSRAERELRVKVLFVHQGGIGQFVHLARTLAKDPANQVAHISKEGAPVTPGIPSARYSIPNQSPSTGHPYLTRMESHVLHGQGAANAALKLKDVGFIPDVICVHSGWGEALFLREALPSAKILVYSELYYTAMVNGAGFLPGHRENFDFDCLTRMRNAHTLLSLEAADWAFCPTRWQWSTHPEFVRDRISIVHEGVDTDLLRPDPGAVLRLPNGRTLTHDDETVTYVSRNFCPERGFNVFMRSIETILERRPNSQIVLVGGDDKGYGSNPARGGSWRELMLEKVKIDPDRVHFLGQISHAEYRKVLAISKAHVYLRAIG